MGVKSSYAQNQLSSVTIQSGKYLVFQGTVEMPAIVLETWKRVWAFFETNTEHRRNFISDFEAYSGPGQVAIYIGLEQSHQAY